MISHLTFIPEFYTFYIQKSPKISFGTLNLLLFSASVNGASLHPFLQPKTKELFLTPLFLL